MIRSEKGAILLYARHLEIIGSDMLTSITRASGGIYIYDQRYSFALA